MTGQAGTHMRAAETTLAVPAEDVVFSRQELRGSRILVVMPSIPVLGMERANLQIMKMMRERGADVLFVVNAFPGEKVTREVERIGFAWAAAPVAERPRIPRTLREGFAVMAAWANGARAISRICREYRPTHIHLTSVAYVLYAAPTLFRAQCRVVLRQPNAPDRHLSGRRQAVSDAVWRRLVEPLCDTIVCNSRFSYEGLRATGLQDAKLRVIHNCLAERRSEVGSDASPLDPAHFNIVFAGQLTPPKGIETLLRAACDLVVEHEEMRFHLAGWRSPYAEGLERDVEAMGLGSSIRFVGEIDDVLGLLEMADLHVCPSICDDSFPNTVLEAKSEGVPSVVFSSGGIPELVRHGVDGYVCTDKTADALREGILYFFRNREALRSAGDAARQSLIRFSPERIASEWAAVFHASGAPGE